MNSKKNKILVVCQKDISIVDDDKINQNSVIKFSNDANTAFICSKLEIQNIKIYNIIGNEIHCNMKSIDNNSIQLDLTKLNRGLYFIRLKTQNSIENIKLTIN
ncbi:hypothetical protein SDC9_194843 [bioreactor metagenome]|uniref:Secretion system C-terminal sorting domain-containing protein n=1 Tax=bioreactor metagenome TaxID=1076179 RepID=A0A645I8V6_9ZZZZ